MWSVSPLNVKLNKLLNIHILITIFFTFPYKIAQLSYNWTEVAAFKPEQKNVYIYTSPSVCVDVRNADLSTLCTMMLQM